MTRTSNTIAVAEQALLPSAETDEQLFLRYRDEHDSTTYRPSADLAEDVFQATFERVHEKRDLFRAGRRLRPWLYSIATHLAVDALRKAKRSRAASLEQVRTGEEGEHAAGLGELLRAGTPGPEAAAEEREERAWLRQAVYALPEHLRSTVILYFFRS